jgi:hypothetical protein
LQLEKNQTNLRNPCFYKKSGRFTESLHFAKKSGGFIKSLRLTEKQADDRVLAGVNILRLVKNQRDWESWRPANCLGSEESSVADFPLAWLKSSRSDPRRCVVSHMQSPSEEMAQAALLLWADCTGCLHQPALPKFTQQPKTRRPLEFSLIPAKSQKS